jgi:tripartite-type tricarboxylate transporter receptor subunit TctC
MDAQGGTAVAKWLGAFVLIGGLLGVSNAQAQSFPARPITIIVTSAAGGVTDVVARAVGQRLSEAWGQQVIIENKGGAAHTIGAAAVAKAAPDGYTLMACESGTIVINPSIYAKGKLPYDAEKDFAPITGLTRYAQALITHPSVPAQNVKELIDLAKAKPGEINYGTAGIGSAPHMNIAMLESMAGIKLTPVHYRGAAPALNDLIGGHIKLMSVSTTLSLEPARAGRVKMLGVGSLKRLPQAPEMPTVAESGLPGYEAPGWLGLFAPAGTPREVVTKINAEVHKIVNDPAFREKFLTPQMFEPMTSAPEPFAELIRVETAKWAKVIRDANLSID